MQPILHRLGLSSQLDILLWRISEFWRKFGKFWLDTTSVGSSQPTQYVPQVKIRDFNSWTTFFSYTSFSFTEPHCLFLFRVVGFVSRDAAFSSHQFLFAFSVVLLSLLTGFYLHLCVHWFCYGSFSSIFGFFHFRLACASSVVVSVEFFILGSLRFHHTHLVGSFVAFSSTFFSIFDICDLLTFLHCRFLRMLYT